MNEPAAVPIAIPGVSHHTANVTALETFRFPNEPEFLKKASQQFKGVLLLQTCNRVELIVEGDADNSGISSPDREDGISSCTVGKVHYAISSALHPV